MSGRVSISRKTAQALVVAAGPSCRDDPFYRRAYDELCSALKPKKSVQASRKRRAQKKTEHRAETSDVHAAVMMRAGGRCDNCRCESPLDLEHMFGRVKTPQSEGEYCPTCGSRKTPTRGLVSGSVRIVLCDYLGCVLVVGSDLRPITKDEWLAMDGGDRNLILAAREQSVLPAPEKVA